jgi:D-glycero-alpha-D-manno-heptose-7-phosphate kinase
MIEFGQDKNLVHPIRLDSIIASELEECLVLCDTGMEHNSGRLHEKQRTEFHGDPGRAASFHDAVVLSRRMHSHLIRGELRDFAGCLHQAWLLKQRMSSGTSNDRVRKIYEEAIQAGALGGKVLGAGAGGFFVFFTNPNQRPSVVAALRRMGCTLRPFRFESDGVVSWRTRVI